MDRRLASIQLNDTAHNRQPNTASLRPLRIEPHKWLKHPLLLPLRDPGTVIRDRKPHTVSVPFGGHAYFRFRMIDELNRIRHEIFEYLSEIGEMAGDHGQVSLHMHPDVFGLKAPAQLLGDILKSHGWIDRLERREGCAYP